MSSARQSNYRRNLNDYLADYWLGEATLTVNRLTTTGGFEVLGASRKGVRGVALTSVQTPLASLFKFQGWADKFTTTPPNGVRDLYATVGFGGRAGQWGAPGLSATYYRFRSDWLGQYYGDEEDMLASLKRGHTTIAARYARYRAAAFATDTDKLWLEIERVF